eukprot:NODE_2044_length_2306_cov_16.670032.p1 GENE.NODE_2044_length_2306_cov_16.670032~~NODE_2044_length_2306_cov_16.670032.p1  ORF type:complete len:659 (+),score=136.75 NODE_2044_length_2306_cov_16.670032:143-2119(+)
MQPSSSVQSRLNMNNETSALQVGDMLAAASSQAGAASDDEDGQPFFRRRSPEEFHRLEVMTSGLTPRLRHTDDQASAVVNLQVPDLFNGKARRKVDVRVHLPPHGQDPTSVTMAVATMALVSAFRDEIVTQHANRLGGASAGQYELRFYDEEEGEPDFDCPPFDLALQVGCLDVSDIALCLAQPTTDALPTLLAGSDLAMGKSKLRGSDLPLLPTGPNVGMGPAGEAEAAPPTMASPRAVLFKAGAASSPGAAIACTGQHPRRRTQSSPRGGGERSSRRMRHRGTPSTQAVVRGGFEKLHPVMVRSEREATDEATGLIVGTGASHPSAEVNAGGANATQMLSVTLPPSAVPEAGGDEVPADDSAGIDGTRPGNTVKICTPNETTLLEILKGLSEVCACVYDPVDFDFERIGEDSTHQRLDVNMPVQHLQHDTVALAVVRKEAPVPEPVPRNQRARAAKECDAGTNLRRPALTAFPFTEFSASLTTEYFVSARIRGSNMRPVECVLVVGRERLTHRTAPAKMQIGHYGELAMRVGGVLAHYICHSGKPLPLSSFTKQSQAEREILAEQRVQDIREVVQDADDKRGFMVAYHNAEDVGATRRIEYQAQTPTECAEVVARMRVLVTLGSRRQHAAACSSVRRCTIARAATKSSPGMCPANS